MIICGRIGSSSRTALDEAGLGHLPLDDGDGPLEHVHGRRKLLLELHEVRVLLLADGGRRREVLLGRGDRRAQLLRTPVNNIEYFPPNFEGLVLGCIDADVCK